MNNQTDNIYFETPRRFAYLTRPKLLRAFIPAGLIGTYLLLNERSEPIYIGRSDNCVLTRLCNHELLEFSTHVVWEPCATVEKAFRLEASWFHDEAINRNLMNQIHPAKPAGYRGSCPFCGKGYRDALNYALPVLN